MVSGLDLPRRILLLAVFENRFSKNFLGIYRNISRYTRIIVKY